MEETSIFEPFFYFLRERLYFFREGEVGVYDKESIEYWARVFESPFSVWSLSDWFLTFVSTVVGAFYIVFLVAYMILLANFVLSFFVFWKLPKNYLLVSFGAILGFFVAGSTLGFPFYMVGLIAGPFASFLVIHAPFIHKVFTVFSNGFGAGLLFY